MQKALDEGGPKIAMYSGPEGNAYAAQWQPCAEQAIKDAGAELVVKGATNWTPQGESQAAAALAAKGLPDALIYDYTPLAFFDKFIKLGLTPPTQIGGSQTMGAYKAWADAQGTKHEFKSFIAASQITLGAVTLHAAVTAHGRRQRSARHRAARADRPRGRGQAVLQPEVPRRGQLRHGPAGGSAPPGVRGRRLITAPQSRSAA